MAKKRRTTAPVSSKQPSWLPLAALALATIGGVLAAWLIRMHFALKADAGAGSACDFGGYFDCDIVNASRFASVLGIPVAYEALAAYILLGAVAVADLRAASRTPRVAACARVIGTIAVAYSAYLALLSLTVLHALCILCVGLYVVNAGVAALGWRVRASNAGAIKTLQADLRLLVDGLRARSAQVGVVALLLGGFVMRELSERSDAQGMRPMTTVPAQNISMSVAPGHSEGPADSRVLVVEFSDFECPHCKTASATLEQLRSEFSGRVRFIFKHFPLDRRCNRNEPHARHRDACAAADAAICAGKQDRLWQFQKEVFALGATDEGLQAAARAVGLDIAAWEQCRWRSDAREAVTADVEDGLRLGVRSTPTVLVGDQLMVGARAQEGLSAEIRRQLSEGGERTSEDESGTNPPRVWE